MSLGRNTNGFSSLPQRHPAADLDFLTNPYKWAVFFEDFLAYDIGQASGNPYNLTATNGTDAIVGPTGVLTLTLGGADNDLAQLQAKAAPFQTNGKRLYMQARAKIALDSATTIAANEVFIGLSSIQTGANFFAADGLSLTMDDALGFFKLDTATGISAVMGEADSRSTELNVFTPTDDVWFTVGVYYDGSKAFFYHGFDVDGSDMVQVAEISTNDATSVLAPTLYIKAGAAKANVLHCDYFFVAAER